MKTYPYQNTDLKNIKGEHWKDIPGFELYFKVSNYGRIKRLQYEQEYIDGRVYIKPVKIIKPVVMNIRNEFMHDTIFFLRTTITLHKQKYNYSVARLVYHCFKQPIDMDDASIVILAKDRNGLNVRPGNLKVASLAEKQQRIFQLHRRAPLVIGKAARQKAIANVRLTKNKQVTQYTKQGKKIKTYPSIAIASGNTGISQSHISSRARGVEYSAGGFLWRFGNAKHIDIRPLLKRSEERRKNNKEIFGKKVSQYTMKGKRVAPYPTIADAAKATGIHTGEISLVLQHKRASAGGFYWIKGYGPTRIDLSKHQYGDALRSKNRRRPIKQYSIKGRYLQTFESIKAAAYEVSVNVTTIIGALTGKQETAGGYKWKYAKRKL